MNYRSTEKQHTILFFICFKLRFKKENMVAASIRGSQPQCFQLWGFSPFRNNKSLGLHIKMPHRDAQNALTVAVLYMHSYKISTLEESLTFSKSYTHGREGPKLYVTICIVLQTAQWKSLLSVLQHCRKQTKSVRMHGSNTDIVIKKLLNQLLLCSFFWYFSRSVLPSSK